MECRRFRITLISANDLPVVKGSGKMKVYAKISIAGKRKSEKRTPTDKDGEINPRWNFTLWYKVAEALIQKEDVKIAIKLYADNNPRDKYVGELNLTLKNLFDSGLAAEKVSYAIEHKRDVSFSKGTLQISYSFGEKILVKNPTGWKRAMDNGATILLKGTCLLAFGFIFEEDDDVVDDHDVLVKT